jgi:DNA polymerase-3 subunit alpha
MERAAQAQKDRKSGQTSLFGLVPAVANAGQAEPYAACEEWPPKQLLAFEKECLGFYITGHPLDRYQADLSRYANSTTGDLADRAGRDDEVSVGGVVTEYRDKPTKSGTGRVAFFNLEDQYGKVEVVVFPKTFERVHEILKSDEPLLCTGKVRDEGDAEKPQVKFFLDDAIPLARARAEKTTQIHLFLNAEVVSPPQIEELKGILKGHPGSCDTFIHLKIPMRSETVVPLGADFRDAPTDDLLLRIERLFGDRVALLR